MEETIICPHCDVLFSTSSWEYANQNTAQCWNCDKVFGMTTIVKIITHK